MTRRTAIHSAAIVPFSAVRGAAANSAPTVGLIGCGNRGSYLAGLLTEHTQARLTGLCDLYPEKIAATRKAIGRENVTAFSDLEKMLASPVDAVVIATPVFLHPEHFEKAVAAGKHVYLEKPAAPDVEGCRRVERAAAGAAKDRDLGFGYQRRHGELYLEAHRFLGDGKIGPVRMARVRFIKSERPPAKGGVPVPRTFNEKVKNWSYWRELCGDLIVENNCHLVDSMNWFVGGRPESAVGQGGRTIIRVGDIRDHGTVAYRYGGEVQGELSGSTVAPPGHRDVREEFYGEKGWMEVSEVGWRYRLSAAEAGEKKSPRNISIDSVQAFARRIESGKTENTIARGVESTLTAILGRLAMDLRRSVTWGEMLASNGWPR